jgi:hypothetical protein
VWTTFASAASLAPPATFAGPLSVVLAAAFAEAAVFGFTVLLTGVLLVGMGLFSRWSLASKKLRQRLIERSDESYRKGYWPWASR